MTAQDVINLAKNAELKQLAIKNDELAVLGYLNLGLLELYKRFPLEEAEAIITLRDGKTRYKLDGTDADVAMTAGKDLLAIAGVYTTALSSHIDMYGYSTKVIPMSINDEDDPAGVNTPSFNTLEVPAVATGALISVIYRVAPTFLTALTDIVPMPPQLLEALLNYIGYRGHGSINGELKTENQSHYVRFENSVKRVILDGLIPTDDLISKKLFHRGFV